MPPRKLAGFTLIELLVVVAIIVVLLALLVPSLDKAVYQATLATCAAQQDGQVTGFQAYAVEFKRVYPYKQAVHVASSSWVMDQLSQALNTPSPSGNYDYRPVIANYVNIKMFVDPLAGDVDLSLNEPYNNGSTILSSYHQLEGFKFAFGGGMTKIGGRLSFGGNRFSVLVADKMHFNQGDNYAISSHGDKTLGRGVLAERRGEGAVNGLYGTYTYTHWNYIGLDGANTHGLLDMNYGMQDGSVRRVTDVDVAPYGTPASSGDYPLRALPFFDEASAEDALVVHNWLPADN